MQLDRPAATHLSLTIRAEADTEALGRALAQVVRARDVIGLVGTLGAGKTRLSRAIAESLGVDPAAVASPTFVLIHEYEGSSLPIYHFDAYRLANPAEFDALGAADYWTEAAGLCLIEWADLVADRLPPETWWVHLSLGAGPTARRVALSHPEPERIDQLVTALTSIEP